MDASRANRSGSASTAWPSPGLRRRLLIADGWRAWRRRTGGRRASRRARRASGGRAAGGRGLGAVVLAPGAAAAERQHRAEKTDDLGRLHGSPLLRSALRGRRGACTRRRQSGDAIAAVATCVNPKEMIPLWQNLCGLANGVQVSALFLPLPPRRFCGAAEEEYRVKGTKFSPGLAASRRRERKLLRFRPSQLLVRQSGAKKCNGREPFCRLAAIRSLMTGEASSCWTRRKPGGSPAGPFRRLSSPFPRGQRGARTSGVGRGGRGFHAPTAATAALR